MALNTHTRGPQPRRHGRCAGSPWEKWTKRRRYIRRFPRWLESNRKPNGARSRSAG